MIITSIQIRRFENSVTKMKAVVSVTLDNMIVIHDIKILQSETGLFLAMPSKQTKAGTFKDVVHPINSNVRTAFEKLILSGFEYAVGGNFSKIEMLYTLRGTIDLLRQDFANFQISNTSASFSPGIPEKQPTVTVQKKVEHESVDENLLKWLES